MFVLIPARVQIYPLDMSLPLRKWWYGPFYFFLKTQGEPLPLHPFSNELPPSFLLTSASQSHFVTSALWGRAESIERVQRNFADVLYVLPLFHLPSFLSKPLLFLVVQSERAPSPLREAVWPNQLSFWLADASEPPHTPGRPNLLPLRPTESAHVLLAIYLFFVGCTRTTSFIVFDN